MVMVPSYPQIIWAGRPGCSRVVAEFWVSEQDLWFVIFIDDEDEALKVEVFSPATKQRSVVIDFAEVERLIEAAKGELLAMTKPKR
jgi:hypothetical protein